MVNWMKESELLVLFILNICIFLVSFFMMTLVLHIVFDDDVDEVPCNCKEKCYDEADEEMWRRQDGPFDEEEILWA